jgi:hypothetical protein
MPFLLRNDARNWFRSVNDEFDLAFDMYYLCLIPGLSQGEKRRISNDRTSELVSNFPGAYQSKGRLIVSLLLSRELKELAVDFSNREELHKQVSSLVDSMSPSRLSPEGMSRMNQYSHGGYEVLIDWFDDRPRSLEGFLPHYCRKVRSAERNR